MFYSPGLTWFDIYFGILFVGYFLYKFFSFIIKKAIKLYKQYSFECWIERNKQYIPIAHAYLYYYMRNIKKKISTLLQSPILIHVGKKLIGNR